MTYVTRTALVFGLLICIAADGLAQSGNNMVTRMHQHENNILQMYLEYQKLYYEDKSRVQELAAFENLLTVYIEQVMEIYETLSLAAKKNQVPRDIASRTMVFKSLMFLEKAPLNSQYFERACYEYFKALKIYEDTNDPPVIYKDLPQPIQAGSKTYYRLMDLLNDKGRGLQDFGKATISFRNFMVTADFDPENLELVRLSGFDHASWNYTFDLAETRIKEAFAQVFRKTREVETYVSLPAGTYELRLHGSIKSDFTTLTRFYVRANQQHNYVLEPLADWIILYENPTDKRPDFYKYQRNKSTFAADGMTGNLSMQADGTTAGNGHDRNGSNGESSTKHVSLVADVVRDLLPTFEIKMIFDFNDPQIKENAIEIISRSVVEFVKSPNYYNTWSDWTASWEISHKVRDIISPGSLIPIELVQLVYRILSEL